MEQKKKVQQQQPAEQTDVNDQYRNSVLAAIGAPEHVKLMRDADAEFIKEVRRILDLPDKFKFANNLPTKKPVTRKQLNELQVAIVKNVAVRRTVNYLYKPQEVVSETWPKYLIEHNFILQISADAQAQPNNTKQP